MGRRAVIAVSSVSAGAMLVAGTGGPAMADPAPDGPCLTSAGHTVATPPWDDSFYDCVPQYGVGKVEFDVTSTDPLPVDFDLTNPVTNTADAGGAAGGNAYFGGGPIPGFDNLSQTGSSANTRHYDGALYYQVSAVTPLDATTPPAACAPGTELYDFAYRVSYLPTTVTFTTTTADPQLVTTVTSGPVSLDLYLNASSGAFETGEPQCATNGTATILGQTSGDGEFEVVTQTNATDLSPFPLAFDFGIAVIPTPADLGDFETEALPVPSVDPALAETGSRPAYGLGWLGLALLAAGGLLTAFAGSAGAAGRGKHRHQKV